MVFKEGQLVCAANGSPFELCCELVIYKRKILDGDKHVCHIIGSPKSSYIYREVRPVDSMYDVALSDRCNPGTALFDLASEVSSLKSRLHTSRMIREQLEKQIKELEDKLACCSRTSTVG